MSGAFCTQCGIHIVNGSDGVASDDGVDDVDGAYGINDVNCINGHIIVDGVDRIDFFAWVPLQVYLKMFMEICNA